MHEGIFIAASGGFKEFQRLNLLANNLANVNTSGFKKDDITFASLIPKLTPTAPLDEARNILQPAHISNANVAYVGGAKFYTDYSQGTLQATKRTFDLALDGEGFFVVQTPGGKAYTRGGNFRLNTENQLVTQRDFPVLGENDQPVVVDALGGVVTVLTDGNIVVGNGLQNTPVGKIKIVKFAEPAALFKEGNGLLRNPNPLMPEQTPKTTLVQQGFLESSNVNPVMEMTRMIETLRAFEAYQRIIQTIDDADDLSANSVGRVA